MLVVLMYTMLEVSGKGFNVFVNKEANRTSKHSSFKIVFIKYYRGSDGSATDS